MFYKIEWAIFIYDGGIKFGFTSIAVLQTPASVAVGAVTLI
jgi:hypothetical protein